MYHEQSEQGEEYETLYPVVSIVVARFNLFPDNPHLHNVFTLSAEKQRDCVFSDQIQIHTIELTPEKAHQLPSLSDDLKNWLDFLSTGHKKSKEDFAMLTQTNDGLALAANRYERLRQNAQLREMAIDHEKKVRDLKGQLSFAREEGLQQGREQGLQQGRKQGAVLSMRKAIVNMLKHRFPKSSASKLDAVLEQIANEQQLNSLLLAAMECSSIEDFTNQIK